MNDLELNSELEITKDNICDFVNVKLKEINDLYPNTTYGLDFYKFHISL